MCAGPLADFIVCQQTVRVFRRREEDSLSISTFKLGGDLTDSRMPSRELKLGMFQVNLKLNCSTLPLVGCLMFKTTVQVPRLDMS